MAVISAQDSANNFRVSLEVSEVSTSSDDSSTVSWSFYITGIGANHFETYWIPRKATVNGTEVVNTSSPTRCNRKETVSWGSGTLKIPSSTKSITFSMFARGLGDYSWTGDLTASGTLKLTRKQKDDSVDKAENYLTQKFKVISTVWDVINERYKQIELGESESTLSDAVTAAIEDKSSKITNQKMISVTQKIDYEIGEISDTVAAVSESVEGVTTQITQLTQSVDGLNASVSSVTTVGEGISIGGRNILLNTATFPIGDGTYSAANWAYEETGTNDTIFSVDDPPVNGISSGARIECTSSSDVGYIYQNGIPGLMNAAKYTVSGFRRIQPGSTATSVRPWVREVYNGESADIDSVRDLSEPEELTETRWAPFSYTFVSTVPNNTPVNFQFGIYKTPGVIEYCGLKLERGSTKTDWSAAPEDIKQYADTVTTTAVQNLSSEFNITAEGIRSQVQEITSTLSDEIEEGVSDYLNDHKYVTQSELEQTASNITATFTETVDKVNDGDAYLQQIKTYITAGSDGLTIAKSNSQIKSQFTNSSLDFTNNSNTKLAWVDAEDGLGGEQLSVGSATVQGNRWRIFTTDNGTHLRFTRHN